MTNIQAKAHLSDGDVVPVVTYLYDVLRTKAPLHDSIQRGDWYQEISIIVLTKSTEALICENSLGFLYTCVENKMRSQVRHWLAERKITEDLLHLVVGFDNYLNTKGFDEACWEKVLRLTQEQIREKPKQKHDFYNTLVHFILFDDQAARAKLLSQVSSGHLTREKKVVKGMLKKSIEKVLVEEGLWYS